jgi:hypothetical protein
MEDYCKFIIVVVIACMIYVFVQERLNKYDKKHTLDISQSHIYYS